MDFLFDKRLISMDTGWGPIKKIGLNPITARFTLQWQFSMDDNNNNKIFVKCELL